MIHSIILAIFITLCSTVHAHSEQKFLGTAGANWSEYSSDLARTKYSPLNLINKSNVKKAKVVWRWTSPDMEILKNNPNLFTMYNETTPLAIDGYLYVSTQLGQVAKINGTTGKTIWVYNPESYKNKEYPPNLGFVHRGVTYSENRIFIGTPDAYLIALDATTGRPIESFGQNGKIDLLDSLSRNGASIQRWLYSVSSPVTICKGTIIVGSSITDVVHDQTIPPGDVRGFDINTGKLKWTFHTIPAAGEKGYNTWEPGSAEKTGNANVWSVMSADTQLGYVYLPVSTPSNDYYGADRKGDGLYGESLVCLSCINGEVKWHYQIVHHGLWDYDLPASPNLMDIKVNGKKIKAVVQVTKQAYAFAFDRVTGEPIWPIEEQPVLQSKVEASSLTQPVPTLPKPFDTQGVTDDNLLNITPELKAQAKAIADQYVTGPLYTPPSADKKGLLFLPGTIGGASWAGAAFHPLKQMLYVSSVTKPMVATLEPSKTEPGKYFYNMFKSIITGTDGKPTTLPLIKPPFGRLTAIDMRTGLQAWQIPMGKGPKQDPRFKDAIIGTEWEKKDMGWDRRAFVLATKELLFVGQAGAASIVGLTPRMHGLKVAVNENPDEQNLKVIDPDSGQLLHEIPLMDGVAAPVAGEAKSSGNIYGAPMTFMNRKKKQVIVLPVGGANLKAEFIGIEVVD